MASKYVNNPKYYDLNFQQPLKIKSKFENAAIGDILIFDESLHLKLFEAFKFTAAAVLKFKRAIVDNRQVTKFLVAPLFEYVKLL